MNGGMLLIATIKKGKFLVIYKFKNNLEILQGWFTQEQFINLKDALNIEFCRRVDDESD